MPNPFLSILIPSRRMKYLPATLESIAQQADNNYEVLVAHEPEALDTKNLMLGAEHTADKLNRLAAIAHGTYLMVLADDDILLPNALYMWCRVAQQAGLPDVVMAYRQNMTERAEPTTVQQTYRWDRPTFSIANPVQGWTALVKHEVWAAVGGVAQDQLWQDYDFWYKCFLQGANALAIQEPLWGYRRHADQIPDNSPLWTEAWRRLYNQHPELRGV